MTAVVAAALAGGGAAAASTHGRTVVRLPFTAHHVDRSTGLRISIHYRDAHDPDAKPKTFHRLEIELPRGTRIDATVVPECGASDAELLALGPAACDPGSRVGSGTATLMTGLPAPADLVTADVTILQGHGELLDLFRPRGSSQTVAVDHVKITGRTLVDEPPAVPGGPPDGRSAVRDVHLAVGARTAKDGRAYLRTPSTCPRAHVWRSRFTVFYDDGVTDVASATTGCVVPPPPPVPPHRPCGRTCVLHDVGDDD